jgi:hypothetical protein
MFMPRDNDVQRQNVITRHIRSGNLFVPSTFVIFGGIKKALIMTDKKTSKTRGRSDAGDTFSKDELSDKIGSNLRQFYDDVLNEPVPDDFLSLLTQADTTSK